MTKSIKTAFSSALLAVVVLTGLLGPAMSAEAKVKAPSKPADQVLAEFMIGLDKMNNAKFSYQNIALVYEPKERNPEYGYANFTRGVTQRSIENPSDWETSANSRIIQFDEETGVETRINFIQKGEFVYVRFDKTPNQKFSGQWIRMSLSEYDAFGEYLGLDEAFDSIGISTTEDEIENLETVYDLSVKHNVYVEYEKPIVRKIQGRQVVIYSYEYNAKTVAAYFNEYAQTMTPEEKKDSIFAIEGFEEGLANQAFVDQFVKKSNLTIVLDYTTGEPILVTYYDVIPAFGMRDEKIELVSSIQWAPKKKAAKIIAPKKYISVPQAKVLIDEYKKSLTEGN